MIDISFTCFVQAEKAPAKKKLGASSRKKKKSKAEVGACFVMQPYFAMAALRLATYAGRLCPLRVSCDKTSG